MPKTYFIYKDSSGLRWRDQSLNAPGGYLPSELQTAEQMRQYLGRGQRVDLLFKNQFEQPIKHYQIKRGNNFATVDYEKKLILDFKPEIIEYLKNYVPEEIAEQSDKIVNFEHRIELLKASASPETLKDLQTFEAGLSSDENLKTLCRDHAKTYFNQDKINVEFTD
jgi:hypothetical protein